jgi:hypothetical protein
LRECVDTGADTAELTETQYFNHTAYSGATLRANAPRPRFPGSWSQPDMFRDMFWRRGAKQQFEMRRGELLRAFAGATRRHTGMLQ